MTHPKCPACTAPGLVMTAGGIFTCEYCGVTLASEVRVCPACRKVNDLEAEHCVICGEPLTIISQIMVRQSGTAQPYRLQQVRSQAPSIKEQEIRASEKRMKSFEEIDRRREQMFAEAKQAQQEYQRRLSTVLILGTASIFVIVIVLVVLLR